MLTAAHRHLTGWKTGRVPSWLWLRESRPAVIARLVRQTHWTCYLLDSKLRTGFGPAVKPYCWLCVVYRWLSARWHVKPCDWWAL